MTMPCIYVEYERDTFNLLWYVRKSTTAVASLKKLTSKDSQTVVGT